MNREELLKYLDAGNLTHQFVIDLFDSMNGTCRECKYGKGVRSSRYNTRVDATHCEILNQKVKPNFGCNKFKRI